MRQIYSNVDIIFFYMAHKDCYDKNAFYGIGLIYRKEIP